MATYSNNTTIKINSAVNTTVTRGSSGTSTLYTVPANSYLKNNLYIIYALAVTESVTVTIGGITVFSYQNGGAGPAFSGIGSIGTYDLGPGTLIQVTLSGTSSTVTLSTIGTLFTNTP